MEAIRRGHAAMQDAIALQNKMAAEIGKEKKEGVRILLDETLMARVRELAGAGAEALVAMGAGRADRHAAEVALQEQLTEALGEDANAADVHEALETVIQDAMRRRILDTGIRIDGATCAPSGRCRRRWVAAPHPRLRPVQSWRDAGAHHCHPR